MIETLLAFPSLFPLIVRIFEIEPSTFLIASELKYVKWLVEFAFTVHAESLKDSILYSEHPAISEYVSIIVSRFIYLIYPVVNLGNIKINLSVVDIVYETKFTSETDAFFLTFK